MTISPYHLTERLREALRVATERGSDPREFLSMETPISEDLADLPADAECVQISGRTANVENLPRAPGIVAVSAFDITPVIVNAVAGLPAVRVVSLSRLNGVDLAPLSVCKALEHLMLCWHRGRVDLSFLTDLPALRTLYLQDPTSVDLETLPGLPHLAALVVSGGVYTGLRVPSFAPLGRLPGLRRLLIGNARPDDNSLGPIPTLPHLEQLELPNVFSIEEFARLSVLLPNAVGRCLGPLYGPYRTHPCETCGRKKTLTTGTPALQLCETCEPDRVAKRIARWEAARTGAATRPESSE